MKKNFGQNLSIWLFLIILPLFIFRQVFTSRLVPASFNFMAFWYEPFKSQKWVDYPTGIPHKAVGADVFRNLYPLKNLAISLVKSRQWPLWNPYNFSGTPLLANFQTSVFSPSSIFHIFLPFLDAWTMMIILQPILAGILMYLFMRTIKTSHLGALFSASSFAIMPFMVVWLEHGIYGWTLVWLPLILLAIEKLTTRVSWSSFFLLTLGLVLAILGGHPQPLFFVFLISGSYFLFKLTETKAFRKEKLILFILAGMFSFLICAPQILPTAELYRFASISKSSSQFVFKKFLLPPWQLITFLVPDFFGNISAYNFWGHVDYTETIGYFGLLPLIFGILAVLRLKSNRTRFFFLLGLISATFAFALPTTKLLVSLNLPLISTNVPSRIFFVTGFCFLILAGSGVDYWEKHQEFPRFLIWLGVLYFGLLLFSLIAPRIVACPAFRPDCWQIAFRNTLFYCLLFLVMVFLFFVRKAWGKWSVFLLLILNLVSLFYFAQKFLPFSDRIFAYPTVPVIRFLQENAGIDRYIGLGEASIPTDLATYFRIYSTDGYDPLYIKRYGQLLEAANNDGVIKETVLRSDANIDSELKDNVFENKSRRQRILNLLGTKYILVKKNAILPPTDFQLAWGQDDWFVYENLKVLPRLFLAGEVEVEKNSQLIADKIFNSNFDLAQKVVLEEPLPTDFIPDKKSSGTVELIDYQPNRVEIKAQAEGNKILFLSDVLYPGWQVYIDGKKDKIYRADFIFRAVAVPVGEHQVIFSFEPKSFYWGLKISLISLVLFIISLRFVKIKERE